MQNLAPLIAVVRGPGIGQLLAVVDVDVATWRGKIYIQIENYHFQFPIIEKFLERLLLMRDDIGFLWSVVHYSLALYIPSVILKGHSKVY